jgi:glycosyltransferase involved in cell wall biosynthesis
LKRILFIGNDAKYFLTHRLPLAIASKSSGYSVHVAVPFSEDAAKIRSHGFELHIIPITRWGHNPFNEIYTLWTLYRLFRKIKPALSHQATIKPVLYGSLTAWLAGVPATVNSVSGLGYVFLADGLKAHIVRWAVTMIYRLAFKHPRCCVIFQNPNDREDFIRNRLVEPGKTVLVKGSGVDMNEFVVTPYPDSVPLVLLASRMLRDKGVQEFVDAARALKEEGINARFVLAGDEERGNPSTITHELLQTWHESKIVEWWGHCENMPRVLAQSHIVCLPSYREGVPKALIEAAACGRPIVTTDVPGCREIVRHGENGLLVPARDAVALAEALRKLIENPDLRRQMGKKGREIAAAEFSTEIIVGKIMDVYRELQI